MIPHNRPLITPDDRASVDSVLASGWLAAGPEVKALESDFGQLLGGGDACAVSSGTAALFLALKGLHVGPGSKVVIPTYTCSALLNAVYATGAEPLLADVKLNDFTLDVASVERMLGRQKPDALIAVHCYGARADLESLSATGCKIVEDCCQALGGMSPMGPLGTHGAASVFSFYATKIITSGQGGLVFNRVGNVAAAARDYREFDCRETYVPRFNFQMTDLQAAMLRSQLRRIQQIAERRREIAQRYLAAIPDWVKTQDGLSDEGRMVYRFVLTFPNHHTREAMRAHLDQYGIQTIVPIERYEMLHRYLGLDPSQYPHAERLADTTLSLPLYPALTDDQVAIICQALSEARRP